MGRGMLLGLILAGATAGLFEWQAGARRAAIQSEIDGLQARLASEPLRSVAASLGDYEKDKKAADGKQALLDTLAASALCPDKLLAVIAAAVPAGSQLDDVALKGTTVSVRGKTSAMSGATNLATALAASPDIFATGNVGYDRDHFTATGTHVMGGCPPLPALEARAAEPEVKR
jgi:hypothetical protein